MLLPIALSFFSQLVTPVLSPSALASLQGWSQELEESVRVVAPKHYESGSLPIYQRFFGDFPLHGQRYVLQQGSGQNHLSLRSNKNDFQNLPEFDNLFPTVDEIAAVEMAVSNLTNSSSSAANIVWFNRRSHVQLCWEVVTLLEDTGEPVCPTHIESIVDGQTGRVLSQRQIDTNDYSPADPSQDVWGVFPRIVVNNEMGVQGGRTYGSDFDAVCYVEVGSGFGTGILIAPDVVITARHNEAGPGDLVAFGDNLNNAGGLYILEVQSSFLPDGNGWLLDGGDVAILTLDSPVPSTVAEPMNFIDLTNELEGMQCAAVGYGLNGLGSSGHGFSADGYRWGGENIIDRYGLPPVPPGEPQLPGVNIISTDFDNGSPNANTIGGSSPNPIELEATTAPGDSGGPILVQTDGQWLIAGVLSGGTSPFSTYGDISWWTGTSWFRSEIETYGGVFLDETSGACCLADLSCVELIASSCALQGGLYKGDGSACSSYECAAGACCFGLDACTLAIESQCDAAGGDFRGSGSACDTEDCTLPVGSCCIGGVCVPDFDPSLCVSSGGEFQGVGSDCAADPCAPPPASGACCATDGSCSEQTEADCQSSGGSYSGDGTSCAPNPCPQPPAIGACCATDGSCSEQTEAECQGAGGLYSGDSTSCVPNLCPQPPATGACCATDGSCSEQTEADCQSSGGSYNGDGISCVPNPCPQPPATGACCSDDGSCSVLTQASCAASGGIYQGDDIGCEAVVCSDDVVITVDDDFGENPQANFDSIQDAINAASDGATILVYPGTYTGNLDFVLDFGSKSVAVQSTSGASQTSIDAEWSRGLMNFNGATEGVASLVGFTLQNCDIDAVPPVAFNTPSAINILNGASVEIADCVVQDVINGAGGASGINSLVLHVGSEEGGGCGQISFEDCSFFGVSLEEGHFAGIGNCDVNFVSCLFSGIQVLETSDSASMFDVYQATIEILDSEIINCESSSDFFDASGDCEIRDSKILGCFASDWDASSTSIGSSEFCVNTPPIDGFTDLGGNIDCTPDLGACCVSGVCLNLTEAVCHSAGGSFKGLGSSCTEFGCTDCNNDGLDDLGQIQNGTLKDYDGNLVPDVCEAVQWSVDDGGNGHWYQVVQKDEIDWYESDAQSIDIGGYLASITSSAENEFVLSLLSESVFNGSRGPWLGGIQPAGSSEPDGGWVWSTGENFVFTGWLEGSPDNNCSGINEDRIHFGSPSGELGGIVGWDDIPGTDSCVAPPKSFVTEWSADCNSDGLVDFGQLLDGTLLDLDNDGVPDECQCIEDFILNDGIVNFSEILAILNAWGSCSEPCPQDVNVDGIVGFQDLLQILNAWGPCDP